jgi:outer membrane protein assembly complex protein YaeT
MDGRAVKAAGWLLLVLVLQAWPLGVRAQELAAPARVREVEWSLPPGDDPAAVQALWALDQGQLLSPRELRSAVLRLYQTGRYRNVIVRAQPVAPPPGEGGAWVALEVEAQAQRRLARLSVRHAGSAVVPDDALRTAARLAPGEPFDDEDLSAATARILAVLARKGYREARVDAAVRGEAALTAELTVAAGPPTRVRAVRVEGDAVPATPALTRLATRPGAVLDQDRLAEDAKALRVALHAAGYRRARVGAPEVREAGREVDVVFPVIAGPRIRVAFQGNAELPTELLEKQMGLEPDQPLDAGVLELALDRVRALYRAHGFAAAQVEQEEQPHGDEVWVVFRVYEGLRHRVRVVRFEGPTAHSQDWLHERLVAYLAQDQALPAESEEVDHAELQAATNPTVRPWPARPSPMALGEYWEEASWDKAAERLVDELRGEGYLEAAYLGTQVVLDQPSRGLELTLRLREGPRTDVEAVVIEGNQALALEALAPAVPLRPGEPLAWAKVEEGRSALIRRYAARGHVFARVDVREQLDPSRHRATLRYVIEEGPQVHVGRILVTGNRRTREGLIRANLRLAEGQVYDPEAASRSQTALLDTGVFRSVTLRLEDPEAPRETKDLVVEVAERPYATLTQALGFSIADGPRAQLEYARPNVLGRAMELTLRGKVNYPTNAFGLRPDLVDRRAEDRLEGQVETGLRTARLHVLPVPASARLNLIGEVVHRPAYNLRRASGVAGLDVGVTSRVTFSLQYELEVDDIARTGAVGHLTEVDVERLRFDEGTTTLHAVRPSLALDFRDNSVHPRKGFLLTGSAEWERSLGARGERILGGLLPGSGIHTNLLKVAGLLSIYVPIPGQAVLALSARAGQVFPLDGRSRTIIPKRFFLGGASSLRGFGEEQLVQQDVRAQLAEEARLCATSPTAVGCTERGRRVTQGEMPISEGGEAFLLGKAELRLPVTGRLELGLFFDAGNLWLDPKRVNPRILRPCAGVGARFVTPIGPAALDLGFNLNRDKRINEPVWSPHFTIGLF